MRLVAAMLVAVVPALVASAQEQKPVPKDSVRVYVPGCARGYIFTAAAPTEDRPGGSPIPEGTRLRMNGPKKIMTEIKGNEGTRIELTGLMKRGQVGPEGVNIGRGVRVTPGTGGPSATLGGGMGSPTAGQIQIDVEGWRAVPGDCPR
ncbi:MAG: hypothetical protein QM736_25655 [Vicinamibacterales bacterium]